MMLGPMKKKVIATGIVSFLIPTILLCVFFVLYAKKANSEVEYWKDKAEVDQRYVFSGDMPIDHIVMSSDLKLVGVKTESMPYNSFGSGDIGKVVGQRLRIPALNGTIVTSAMFFPEEDVVANDVRSKEFNMITLPSDLEEGDFIDIRILFPTGEDYLVVAGIEVKQLGTSSDSNTVFLNLDEEEILRLSGAIIESYIADSINVYAVKYVDPIQQLYTEKTVDYVALYRETLQSLIKARSTEEMVTVSGDVIKDENGELMLDANGQPMYEEITQTQTKQVSESDISIKDIALAAGMSERDVEAVRRAIAENDTMALNLYENKLVSTKGTLIENYPLREDVAKLVKNNPNIIDEIKIKYDVEGLKAQRSQLFEDNVLSIFTQDPYTGEPITNDQVLQNIATKLDEQIETQRAERREYLQTILRNSMLSAAN